MRMNTFPSKLRALTGALALAALGLGVSVHGQTATWIGPTTDSLWNTAGNWDIGVPAEGTNALLGTGSAVTYDAPMAAGSFGSLTLNGALSINAAGFVVGASGNTAVLVSGTAARLYVNNGGSMSATNGGLTFNTAAGSSLAAGGSISLQGGLMLGGSGTGNTGFMTNNGGTLSSGSTTVNPNNNSSTSLLIIGGGTSDLGNVTVGRSAAGSGGYSALGSEGLIISNGVVRMTSLSVGGSSANSFLTAFVGGGAVTNTGTFIIRQANTRGSRFLQTGGTVVSTVIEGIRVGVSNGSQTVYFSVAGGTNIAERILLGDCTNGAAAVTVNVTNAANLYLGSGGFATNNPTSFTVALASGGITGAKADWSTVVPLLLPSGTHTFKAADLADAAFNITLNGVVRGNGGIIKTGAGILTLNATNTYAGATTVGQGTLALGAAGSISNSAQITVASGATLDLQAVTSPALLGSQTLNGGGSVAGALTALGGSTLRPGGLAAAGTLTFLNGLTEAGGVNNSIELSTDPNNASANDFINVVGDLTLSGINGILIAPLGGSLPPETAYPIIQYSGNLNGSLANLSLSGTSGSLSNDASGKVIYLVTGAAVRAPASVVWLGGLGGNAWDTIATSNWLNGVSRDIFVTGDDARFDDTGAANPVVNVAGSVSPSALTVDAAANYVWAGSGSIDGSTGLTKTNSGTLSILNTNSYVGQTFLGGGVVEAIRLANGGSVSSIGSASSFGTNLQFYGGTLRYLGASASMDRAAILNVGGGTIDVTNSSATLTLNGALSGDGGLTKDGPGTLTLAVDNSFTNGVVISNGVLRVNSVGGPGSGGITNYGSTFRLTTSTTLGNVVDWEGNCTLDLNNTGGNQALDGAWSGSGTVNFINQQSSTLRTFTMGGNGAGGGSMLNFSGTVNLGTNLGFFRFNDGGGTFNSGSTNMLLDLGTGTATFTCRNRGVMIYLGALAGGSGTILTHGTDGSGTTTYVVGDRNADSTFAGNINNASGAPIALAKVGSATWTLSGNCGHFGSTTVSNGVLALSGSATLPNTPAIDVRAEAVLDTSARTDGTLALNSGQTLLGDGTVRGSITVKSNATVSPGFSAGSVGILTITNALTLQAGGILQMEVDHYMATNDLIQGLASVTYGGTLSVGLLSVDITSNFKLFSAGAYGGAFDAITPASPGPGWVWDASSLAVDGTLKVKNVVLTQPVIGNVSVTGTNLTVSGTGGPGYLNYTVYGSSDVTLPLVSWIPVGTGVFKADGSFSITTSVDPAQPQQFYQVQYFAP